MNDDQIESILKQTPLAKPSGRMDALVMRSRPRRLWPTVAISSALAAAAAVLAMVMLQGVLWSPSGHGDHVAIGHAQIIKVEPVSEIIGKPRVGVIDGVQRAIVDKPQKFRVTWVDRDGATHQVTVGNSHTETIVLEGTVK